MALYSGFSNYEEVNSDKRIQSAEEEPLFWSGRESEYRAYREEWNHAAKDATYLPEKPLCITIDASSLCQLRCRGCHQSIEGAIEHPGALPFEKAKKIIDEMAELSIPSLALTWKGEPTLCKDLVQIVKYASDKRILEIRLVTNGLPPKQRPDTLIRLAEAGLHRMIISVDGHSTQTFEYYRRGGNYNELMSNIHSLLKWKREHKSAFPLIRIQCVRTKFNAHESDDFVRYWNGIEGVNDVRISDVMDRTGKGNQMSVSDQISIGRVACPQIRQRIVISDKVEYAYVCCHDWAETYPVGDFLKDQSLISIWNSSRFNFLRKAHQDGNFESITMCQSGRCAAKETYLWEKKDASVETILSSGEGRRH